MQQIHVSRYSYPQQVGYAGTIEPADRSWIMFIDLDGRPTVYLHRDELTGACLPDDPIERAETIARMRAQEELDPPDTDHVIPGSPAAYKRDHAK